MNKVQLMLGQLCPPVMLELKQPCGVPDNVARIAGITFRQITEKGEPKYEIESLQAVTAYGELMGAVYDATPKDFENTDNLSKFLKDVPALCGEYLEKVKAHMDAQNKLVEAAPSGMSADQIADAVTPPNLKLVLPNE